MKRLLSLVAVMALVASVLPGTGIAGFRGAFDPITRSDIAAGDGVTFGNGLANGIQTPAVRPRPISSLDGIPTMERWVSFTTRDQVFQHETSREIWQFYDRTQQAALVSTIDQARSRILGDPTGVVSYIDPAWSPDGKYLAYVQTDSQVSGCALMVQQYSVSTNMAVSITPVGSAITVIPLTPGVRPRHPDWSPDGTTLAFDSDATGLSVDIYTVQVFPTVGTPVRHTFMNTRSEANPAWAPDGVRIAFDTNQFGPNVLEILDTSTDAVTLAEQNFASVSHDDPDWSSDGNSLYYDAPANEDPQQNQDIWKLDIPSQSKCPIHIDGAGDVHVTVSPTTSLTPDGLPYNNIWFESQALGFGLIVWRANPVQSCYAPLPMSIDMSPATLNFDTGNGSNTQYVGATMSFPPETQAAGYQMTSFNGPKEGIRLRTSLFVSPTMMGLTPATDPSQGAPLPYYQEASGSQQITVKWARRKVENKLISLGIVNSDVPIEVDCYSNRVGRTFRGFGLLHVTSSSLAGSAVKLEQNSPNPFNPVTKINFAVSKDSDVALRVYNVQGRLVKTLFSGRLAQGMHEVTWDGKDTSGRQAASGVYYAKVSSGGNADVIKMVMAK
ncbi:MAG: FlgD immunoglobulin-like domain containing protein [Bacteroidota bacterium]